MMLVAAMLLAGLGAPAARVDVDVESRLALANYADCIVARRGATAQALLDKPYDDRVSRESRSLNGDDCPFATPVMTFDQRLVRKLDGLVLRSALYQAMLRREPGRVAAMSAPPASARFAVGRNWPGSPAMAYASYIERGLCLMTRAEAGSRRLTVSPIASAEEAAALDAIAEPLGRCGWRGEGRLAARGALAEIYYRAGEPAGVS